LMRSKQADVAELFALATGDQLSISRFSLHAVAFYMTPRNRDGFRRLLMDLSLAGVSIVDLALDELHRVVDAMDGYALDFDDAFNVVVAEKLGLTIVSLDTDYDRTPRGRLSPTQAVQSLRTTP